MREGEYHGHVSSEIIRMILFFNPIGLKKTLKKTLLKTVCFNPIGLNREKFYAGLGIVLRIILKNSTYKPINLVYILQLKKTSSSRCII